MKAVSKHWGVSVRPTTVAAAVRSASHRPIVPPNIRREIRQAVQHFPSTLNSS